MRRLIVSACGDRQGARRGVTLIELMMAVAVVGILLAVALPAYQESVRRSRRADAASALAGMAVAMERWRSQQSPATYVGATAAGSGMGPGAPQGVVYASEAPLDGPTKYYDLVIQSAALAAYELRAVPKGAQAADACGTLTLDSTGVKGVVGASGGRTWQDCWR